MLIVTRQCNFRCNYCGQQHEDKIMASEVYDYVLSLIEKKITKREYSSVSISFFGGEPLLAYNNIVKFLRKLNKLSIKYSFKYDSGMTTNAYLLTPNRFDTLVKLGCDSYQITVDGMDYIHNKNRHLRNYHPTWQKIIDNLKYMISTDYDFCISLRTNFNEDFLESADTFYEFVKNNLNDHRIEIYFETIKNHGNENTPNTLDTIGGIVAESEIAHILKSKNLHCSNIFAKPCNYVCKASNPNFYVIDFDATLKKCSHLLDIEDNTVGYLDFNGKINIDEILLSKWNFSDYLSVDTCSDCKLHPLCFGKRCPIDLVKGCFWCEKSVKETNLLELLRAYL